MLPIWRRWSWAVVANNLLISSGAAGRADFAPWRRQRPFPAGSVPKSTIPVRAGPLPCQGPKSAASRRPGYPCLRPLPPSFRMPVPSPGGAASLPGTKIRSVPPPRIPLPEALAAILLDARAESGRGRFLARDQIRSVPPPGYPCLRPLPPSFRMPVPSRAGPLPCQGPKSAASRRPGYPCLRPLPPSFWMPVPSPGGAASLPGTKIRSVPPPRIPLPEALAAILPDARAEGAAAFGGGRSRIATASAPRPWPLRKKMNRPARRANQSAGRGLPPGRPRPEESGRERKRTVTPLSHPPRTS
jgi:hypothetical protein